MSVFLRGGIVDNPSKAREPVLDAVIGHIEFANNPIKFWIEENSWKDKELAALNKQIIEKDEEIKYLRRLVLERINEWN